MSNCYMCDSDLDKILNNFNQPVEYMSMYGHEFCSGVCAWAFEASTALNRKMDDLEIETTKNYNKETLTPEIATVIDMLTAVFQTKQVEYKGNHPDIFRNFNQGAALQGESPEETLLGYVNKQIVSLYDAKKTNPERLKDIDFVEEKAKDIAIYMIILIAMVRRNYAVREKGLPDSKGSNSRL